MHWVQFLVSIYSSFGRKIPQIRRTFSRFSRKINFPSPPPTSMSSSSSSSSSNPLADSQEHQTRNWLDLPRDVVSTIFLKLGAIEILTNAQRVCSLWRNICKDPLLWRTIDMHNSGDLHYDLEIMCRHAIDLSCGQLVDINLEYFGTDDLLNYITDSASHLRRLRLICCYNISNEGLSEVANRLPQLEELDISISNLSKDPLEAIGQRCPLLKSLKFNMEGYSRPHIECDEEALAIAGNMPELRHLQLFGNKLTNDGLLAILDGCPHLESLDIRQCFNVNLGGSLGRRCDEQIKELRRPYDHIDDYPFGAEINDDGSFDEDYPSGMSDIDFLSDDDYYDYYEFSGGSEFSDYDYDAYYEF